MLKRIRLYFKLLFQRMGSSAKGEFLCDKCKYDYGEACSRPERPNAQVCPDFEKK